MLLFFGNSIVKWVGAILGVCVVVLACWFGINATDEALSDEALAAMVVSPIPPPSEKNGFLDFLALGAGEDASTYEVALSRLHAYNNQKHGKGQPSTLDDFPSVKIDQRIPRCRPAESSCLDAASKAPNLQGLLDEQKVFLRRYRAMREKPEFVSLLELKSPEDAIPPFSNLLDGQKLALLKAAIQFNGGDHTGAIEELELENAFHRRMAAHSRTLIDKMIAYAMLSSDALLIAEMVRKIAPGEKSLWPRLATLTRPLSREELDIAPALREEMARSMRAVQTRHHGHTPNLLYEAAKDDPAVFDFDRRPWWDWFAPYLYRPHQSLNEYAVIARMTLGVAAAPSTGFLAASREMTSKVEAMTPSRLSGMILNPAGLIHYYLGLPLFSDYTGRMHGVAGLHTLVRLQVALRAKGALTPGAVAEALSGPIGSAHLDPFAGKPMVFDPKTETIGFESEAKYFYGQTSSLVQRYGRLAIPL